MEQKLKELFNERGLSKVAERIENCGKNEFYLQCLNCESYTKNKQYCKNKLCHECMKMRSIKFMELFTPYLESFGKIKFLTLTTKNLQAITKSDYRHLTLYFNSFTKRLRRLGYKFNKGIIVKETTEKGNGFHLHMHILYDGSYIPQAELSKIWNEVTKDSKIVHILQWRGNAEGAIKYLSKYVTKGHTIFSSDALVDYFVSTKHIRMIQTFGENFIVSKIIHRKVCQSCNSIEWRFIFDIRGLSEAEKKPYNLKVEFFEEDPPLTHENMLLSKIRHVIDLPNNADAIDEILSEQERNYLKRTGTLYQPRYNEYKLLP